MWKTLSDGQKIFIILLFVVPMVGFFPLSIPGALMGALSLFFTRKRYRHWTRFVFGLGVAALGLGGILFLAFGGSFAPHEFEGDMGYGVVSFFLMVTGFHSLGWVLVLEEWLEQRAFRRRLQASSLDSNNKRS